MQPGQKIQPKSPSTRKLYTSPSSASMTNKPKSIGEFNFVSKPAKIRRTDHTDDKYSEVSGSQINSNNGQIYGHVSEELEDGDVRESRNGRNGRASGLGGAGLQILGEKQENIIELRQRLKNIHHFYRIRIEQQRSKNIQRNQIFICLIQQLQKTHNDKILTLQKTLQQIQSDKQQIGVVDQRMSSIKSTIQEILKQSQQLKQDNERKQKQILRKQVGNKDKEVGCVAVKEELDVMREKLEQFQRLRLKENKRSRELMEMIQKAL